jgi:hypothetical protein
MDLSAGIEKTQVKNLLGKGWLTHDGMWFFHTCRQLGIDKANELNKAAVKSLAPVEMERMRRLLGFTREELENFDSLKRFMIAALKLTLPDSVMRGLHFTAPAPDWMHWKWENSQCFAYKGIKQIGELDGYHCGVIYRIECWLEALGIQFVTRPLIEKCLMHENGECEGDIRILSSPR